METTLLSKIIFIVSDLDLWPNDSKINRVLPLPHGNHVVKFGKDPIYRTKVIVRKPVWTPTHPTYPITKYGPSRDGRIKSGKVRNQTWPAFSWWTFFFYKFQMIYFRRTLVIGWKCKKFVFFGKSRKQTPKRKKWQSAKSSLACLLLSLTFSKLESSSTDGLTKDKKYDKEKWNVISWINCEHTGLR